MTDHYPEPPATCLGLSLKSAKDGLATLSSSSGETLEIAFLKGAGWSLEMRYDKAWNGVLRQPFTGAQEELERVEITADEDEVRVTVTAGKDTLVLERGLGVLRFLHGKDLVLETMPGAFLGHAERVELDHSVVSRQQTDLGRHRWHPNEKYLTHMVRFQYPRPRGAMLGLPSQTGELNRNGYRFDLRNYENLIIPRRGHAYQSWPILMHPSEDGKRWTGVFHDNPSGTYVDTGDFYKDRVTFESVTGNGRVYVVHGETPGQLAARWSALLGGNPMPPLWAMGYQQSRWGYASSDEVRGVAKRLRDADMPCDAIYFDLDVMDGNRVFTKNPERYADLQTCLLELRGEGMRGMVIVDPGVKIDEGYPLYDELKASGGYLKNPDGSDLVAAAWPGKVLLPDFGDPAVRTWWAKRQRDYLAEYPFAGLWNDMNEPVNWDGRLQATNAAVTSRGPVEPELNLYGNHMAKASREGWELHAPHERPLIISRSGYPGVQRHAVTWYGDNNAWWEHLRSSIDMAIAYSLCGAAYTGPDVPGFHENPPDDLAVRFFQLGAFLPFFRGHSFIFADSKEPYAFQEPTRSKLREIIKLRYTLLSEWYAAFDRCVRDGTPVLEPVLDDAGNVVRDAFLLFGKLLVCPVTHRDERMRPVWLPDGGWYRYGETGDRLDGGRWLLEDVSDLRLPLFVREGSILVLQEPKRNAEDTLAGEPTYAVYPDAHGHAEGFLFRDDGTRTDDPDAERWRLTSADGKTVKRHAA